jgi:hypothetical protein
MLLMLAGCQNSPQNQQADNVVRKDTMKTVAKMDSEMQLEMERAVILDYVQNIFRVVNDDQRTITGFVNSGLCDRAFCSKSWNKLIKSIKRKEYLTGTLFFEVDYWTMTRDPGMVTFEDFEVTKLVMDEKEKSASVSFVVCEYNDDVPARVDLVYEDGRWVIDNFYDLRYMLNLRHCMWNYLNNDFI